MINYKSPFKDSFYKDERKTYDPSIEVIDGKKVLTYKERIKDLNEGLSYTDFSLSALLAADATDLLSPISPLPGDLLSAADIANSAANNLGSYLDNVNTSNTDENE